MPLGDWQFWVVTVVALAGLWLVIRTVAPRRKGTGPKVPLTIERKKVGGRSR
jgi:hypothetical protein